MFGEASPRLELVVLNSCGAKKGADASPNALAGNKMNRITRWHLSSSEINSSSCKSLAAFVNALLLLLAGASVLFEAVGRLCWPQVRARARARVRARPKP